MNYLFEEFEFKVENRHFITDLDIEYEIEDNYPNIKTIKINKIQEVNKNGDLIDCIEKDKIKIEKHINCNLGIQYEYLKDKAEDKIYAEDDNIVKMGYNEYMENVYAPNKNY